MYEYDEAIQNLAYDMLDKIAEELDYEAGMERTAGIKMPRFGRKDGPASGKNNFEGASAGIGKFIKGKSPQKMVEGFANLSTGKKLMAVGAPIAVGGVAGAGIGHMHRKKINANGQEKAAAYFEEAEIYKQAAEEAYQEALEMEVQALDMFNYFE